MGGGKEVWRGRGKEEGREGSGGKEVLEEREGRRKGGEKEGRRKGGLEREGKEPEPSVREGGGKEEPGGRESWKGRKKIVWCEIIGQEHENTKTEKGKEKWEIERIDEANRRRRKKGRWGE